MLGIATELVLNQAYWFVLVRDKQTMLEIRETMICIRR